VIYKQLIEGSIEDEEDNKEEQDEKNEQKNDIDYNFQCAVIFIKRDIHRAEDEIKEIINKFHSKILILPVVENDNFAIIDTLYNIGISEIFFDTKPENILEQIKSLVETNDNKSNVDKNPVQKNTHYVIDFFEKNGTFIVEISGSLIKKKLIPLKLMFENILKAKFQSIKGIIYIFSDVQESTINFENIWTLLRIWKELGFNYNKISYLTQSELIIKIINKYFSRFGMKHNTDLLEYVKNNYPEISKKDEMAIFDFSAQLIQSPKKIYTG